MQPATRAGSGGGAAAAAAGAGAAGAAAAAAARLEYGGKSLVCYRSRKLLIAQLMRDPVSYVQRYPLQHGYRVWLQGTVVWNGAQPPGAAAAAAKSAAAAAAAAAAPGHIVLDDGSGAVVWVDCTRANLHSPAALAVGAYVMAVGHVRAKALPPPSSANKPAAGAAAAAGVGPAPAAVSVVAHQLNDLSDAPNCESFWALEVVDFALFEAEQQQQQQPPQQQQAAASVGVTKAASVARAAPAAVLPGPWTPTGLATVTPTPTGGLGTPTPKGDRTR